MFVNLLCLFSLSTFIFPHLITHLYHSLLPTFVTHFYVPLSLTLTHFISRYLSTDDGLECGADRGSDGHGRPALPHSVQR